MPELPEVETVARGLSKFLLGQAIAQVEVYRERSVSFPDVESFCRELAGHRFEQIKRRGKYLLFALDNGSTLCVHLGMSGRLLISSSKGITNKHVRVAMRLSNGQELLFEDQRVFGHLWYVKKGTKVEKIIPALGQMGVEPLEDLTAGFLQSSFHGRKQPVKSALLGQHIIAGLGNIYADESLFLAGINPNVSIGELNKDQLACLVEQIKIVLNNAIAAGGSTLRNYTDSQGVNGNYQHKAWVYGRTGQPCRTCKSVIQRIKLSGRSTHFCPTCQNKQTKKLKLKASRK